MSRDIYFSVINSASLYAKPPNFRQLAEDTIFYFYEICNIYLGIYFVYIILYITKPHFVSFKIILLMRCRSSKYKGLYTSDEKNDFRVTKVRTYQFPNFIRSKNDAAQSICWKWTKCRSIKTVVYKSCYLSILSHILLISSNLLAKCLKQHCRP